VPLLEQQSSINAPPIPPALLDDPVCGQYPTCSTVRALCAVGHPDACQTLADVYREGSIPGVPKDPTRGLALLETICNSDAKLGCPRLAEAYEKGQGVPVDKARAMTLLKRACEGGDGTACYLVWDRGDKAFGAAHMESGCEAKDLMSCLGLRSVPGMLPRALAAVQALCSAGDKAACGYIHH
jgi:TPR repeat protein